ncbi:unnamed protein product [Peronospora destructor]|uniref:Uncharacterized protein n=1 Tax=Peronospora destructor TaxID=86335 RepID=A0AAV0UHN5_9STRA|nr:unnamed protein product [Peronospora destructor]
MTNKKSTPKVWALSDEADWRACVEYETKCVVVGDLKVQVLQMEELPVAASLFMLAEMDANVTEISGTRLWTGSHFLSRYLWHHPELVQGKHILELGAGTGICSIVSSKLGAVKCLATDGDEQVVELLAKNVYMNTVEDVVTARSLFWGDEPSAQTLLDEFPDALTNVDIVLAADVTHDVVEKQIIDSGLKFKEIKLPAESVADATVELEECPVEDAERAKLYYITK